MQLLFIDARGHPHVGGSAWLIRIDSSIEVGPYILAANGKIAQMPSMSFRCCFARLRKKAAAAKQNDQSTQDNTPNYQSRDISHHFFPF